MAFIDRIRACSRFDRSAFVPFRVVGTEVGLIRPGFARTLAAYRDVFHVTDDGVDLSDRHPSVEARTAAVDDVLRQLAERGVIRGWRDEPYPVAADASAPALLLMERAALPCSASAPPGYTSTASSVTMVRSRCGSDAAACRSKRLPVSSTRWWQGGSRPNTVLSRR